MLKLGSCSYGVRSLCFFLRHPLFYSTSTSLTNQGNPPSSSFSTSLADFLVNNLGFSNKQSLSFSAKFTKLWKAGDTTEFNFIENVDSVIQFFKQIGFQQSHIQKIIIYEPRILVSRVHETLKPKIELLNDLGMSESDVVQTIVRNPRILRQRLGPVIHALKNVLGSDENVVRILNRSGWINFQCAANYLIPNVELLQKYCGTSSDTIQKHIFRQPNIFTVKTDVLRDILIKVELQLGIPRDSSMFLYGVNLLLCCGEKNIKDKWQVFKSFGWTQSDIMKLIRLNPMCFSSSEARIKKRLGYLMNELGYKPDYLAMETKLFICSMEKRLLPRHRVLQILKEKGLVRVDYRFSTIIVYSEFVFLKRFVLPFEEVHEVYAQMTGSTVGSLNVGRSKSQS
ncbi:transcription termination factor MTERF9, chloroplastic-like [Chenopodium quinoa]|uniref:transcription termination factor MTERF9, chloroplastic-like n=1 Tax=Chenopodium quinoa TaxID=63459 RepID=UPI000B77D447|nr:transcription termination factor MTERF9, chloroplastic-like [Chenopodium quinoa]